MQRYLKPDLTRPPDFESFWDRTIEELSGTDREIQHQRGHEGIREHRDLEHLSFRSLGNVWIRGYSIRWRDHTPRPLIVHSHGYGSDCMIHWDWSDCGANIIGVDIRGFGRSFEALPLKSRWGYILTGIETPETSVLRAAICDYLRAAQVGKMIFENTSRVIYHGFSFSGGLSLMAQAIEPLADVLVAGVPTFGWAEGRNFFVKAGSGSEISAYLDARPESAEDAMLVLRYFDPINFAPDVHCPTLVGVGLEDDVVPAKTVYAIANHLGGPHEIMEFPVSHTNRPEEIEWKRFEDRLLNFACEGPPPGFGSSSSSETTKDQHAQQA